MSRSLYAKGRILTDEELQALQEMSKSNEIETTKRWDDKTRDEVKKRYMAKLTLTKISDETAVPVDTITNWITEGGWVEERNVHYSDIAASYIKDKSRYMSHISGLSLRAISGALENRIAAHNAKPITISEAKMISDIFTNLDKIIKLDTGLPTDTIQHLSVSLDDIRDALTKDKFIDVVPIHKEKKDGRD